MEWVETTGKTIEEAKEAALDELGVDEHDAEFEVVAEPKLGLFGRLRSEGRIRARVRPTTPRAKEDRRDRRRRSRGVSQPGAGAGSPPAPPDMSPAPTGEGPEGPADTSDTASGDPAARAEIGGSPADATFGSPGRNGDGGGGSGDLPPPGPGSSHAPRRRSRRRRPAGTDARGGGETLATPPGVKDAGAATPGSGRGHSRPDDVGAGRGRLGDNEIHDRTDGEDDTFMDVALEEQGNIAEQFLSGLLAAFGIDATIEVELSDEDERIDVQVTGADLGLLIGAKGATLLAIQDLARAVVQHRTNARNGRLYVDIAGYRRQRAAALGDFAIKIAADVLAAGQPIALEPMNAADRKLVHDAITEVAGVESQSVGEDERRHVVITPSVGSTPA
jgi:spoIIIJ-associated protein